MADSIAINVGGGTYTAADTGIDYAADSGLAPYPALTGTTTARVTTAAIANTSDDPLYQSYRTGQDFGYNVNLANGTYVIELQFAETYWTTAGARRFDVHLEGEEVVSDLDIFAAAGGKNIAYTITRTVTVTDGQLNLRLEASGADDVNNALLAGFVIQPQAVGGGQPDQVYVTWGQDTSTTLTVTWQTDTSVPHQVQYRLAGATQWQTEMGSLRPSGTVGELHQATLTGLPPGATIEYRVMGDGGVWSDVYSARTAPGENAAFDFVFFADTGLIGRTDGLAVATQQVINTIDAMNPDFVLGGGDYAYFSSDKRFGTLDATIDEWFSQWKPVISGAPFMPTWGNHEVYLSENVDSWAARMAAPAGYGPGTYSFDVGDVHFVSILAAHETSALPDAQLDWIRADIQAAWASGAKWVIPFMHVPSYSDGTSHTANLALRAQLAPLFDALGVKIVLTTHDQSYERTLPLEGIADRVVTTSTDLDNYSADSDGIVWLKVSPAGKLSNVTGDYSHLLSEPAPSYTAARDDEYHHFARFKVDANDNITVEIWALAGDGTPAFILDQFTYILGAGVTPPGPDAARPHASGNAADVTSATFDIVVRVVFTDAGWGVAPSSIGTNDLAITGPGGVTVSSVKVQANADGSVIADYTLTSSGGFSSGDNGSHTISLIAGAVEDLAGNGISAATLDTFNVNIAATGQFRTLGGTSANDVLAPTTSDHWTVTGLGGSDRIITLSGNDVVTGGGGTDTIATGAGKDLIRFSGSGNGTDIVDGGADLDRIAAGANGTVIGLKSVTGVEEITSGGFTSVSIAGSSAADLLDFTTVTLTGITSIKGNGGGDTIRGSAARDVIAGGSGADILRGNGGADVFDYNSTSETPTSARDRILDFQLGTDDIDLSTIDAVTSLAGNQEFDFVGQAAFSNTAGELRVDRSDPAKTIVFGDVNGDGIADFAIELTGNLALTRADFIL